MEVEQGYAKVDAATETESPTLSSQLHTWLVHYLGKFRGVRGKAPPPDKNYIEMNVSFILSFVAILLLSSLDRWFLTKFGVYNGGEEYTVVMLVGSYAASAGMNHFVFLHIM